jgi:type IV secretion system protein TrbL
LITSISGSSVPSSPVSATGCDWWNLLCQGGQQAADSGLAAITNSMVNGLIALFGQITRIVDESTTVPLADPTYRHTYYGFAALAVPVIAVVFFLALISSAIRRDPRTLTRAVVGIGVAAIGGTVYVLFAQFLVALDDWLAHGVVAVTGSDFGKQMSDLTDKFERMGRSGSLAADALMLVLMAFALIAGVSLWVILLLRKMAILVVVAFAPLLIAGWLWAPTRSWSRKATEVLVALVFSKTVIYMIFGIGMSLLFRTNQSLSDFVGVVVLLCGACFAPLVMLRLVHFAADSHLAGDMVGNLRAGVQPALNRVHVNPAQGLHRKTMASDYASSAKGGTATVSPGGPRADASRAGGGAAGSRAAASSTEAGAAPSAAVPAAAIVAVGAEAVKGAGTAVRKGGGSAAEAADTLGGSTKPEKPTAPGPGSMNTE